MLSKIKERLTSFTYLNVTQFLGALNDNIYKFLIVYFLIGMEGIEHSSTILASTGAIFVLPFLLFSASSGDLADRFSKRDIIVMTKILELVTMALGVLAFALHSIIGSYIVLFLMATQSAIFGPSKYGIIPEIVSSDKISRANGLMTSFTFIAIILGTFLASFLLQVTYRNFIVASIFCTFIALVGLGTSFCIDPTPPAGLVKRFSPFFIREIFQTLKIASKEPSLLPAILGSSFFLFIGAYLQLNIIPFAVQSLHLSDIEGGYLFLLSALGIGVGAMLAGKISGKIVELGLVPLGLIGVAIGCFALDIFSTHLFIILPLVILVGICGGLYQVPLDSYIQVASPNQYRGQVIAAANFLSFSGVLVASGCIYLIADVFDLPADKGFTIMGFITATVSIIYVIKFFDYLTRFLAMLLSKIHFRTKYIDSQNIPNCPTLYFCHHNAWNDTLLILGAQRRRMRFFIEKEQDHSPFLKKLYKLLHVVFIPTIEPLENNKECIENIQKTLKKGISVCIFVENPNLMMQIDKLKDSDYFLKMAAETDYPIVPVKIHKEQNKRIRCFMNSLCNRLNVPANLTFGTPIHGNQCLIHRPHEHTLFENQSL